MQGIPLILLIHICGQLFLLQCNMFLPVVHVEISFFLFILGRPLKSGEKTADEN